MKLCDLHAGKLRNTISLQSVARQTDGAGGWTNVWTAYTTVRSYWVLLSMHERLHSMQLQNPITHKVYIRYREGVTAEHRILMDGVAYNIRGVADLDNRKRWLELLVEGGVAA